MTDVDDWDDDYESPGEQEAAEDRALDRHIEEQADEEYWQHRDEMHGGEECNCPPYEPPKCRWWRWVPLWTPRKGWHCGTPGLCALTGYRSPRAVWRVHRNAYHVAPF